MTATKEDFMLYERQLRSSLMSIAILCFILACTSPTPAQTYTVTDIGTLGGRHSTALSINDYGEVVGYSATANGEIHAFRYFRDTLVDLNTLGGKDSYGAYRSAGASRPAQLTTTKFSGAQAAMGPSPPWLRLLPRVRPIPP